MYIHDIELHILLQRYITRYQYNSLKIFRKLSKLCKTYKYMCKITSLIKLFNLIVKIFNKVYTFYVSFC